METSVNYLISGDIISTNEKKTQNRGIRKKPINIKWKYKFKCFLNDQINSDLNQSGKSTVSNSINGSDNTRSNNWKILS